MKKIFVVLAVLLVACEQTAQPTHSIRSALVMSVDEKVTLPPTVLVGEVHARYVSNQGFQIAGKIIERHVERGTVVKKGQLLARLDNVDTDLSHQASQAKISEAEADLALVRAKLNRQEQLFKNNFISAQALEIDQAQYNVALAQLKQARAQAAVIGNQSRYTRLFAERDGVITEIHAEPGQVVEPGELIAKIAVPDIKEVVIAVPESKMGGVFLDAPARIRLWVDPDSVYDGYVREIAPAADSITRTFQVRVAITNPDSQIHLGMTADVRLENKDNNIFFLPSTAVTRREGKNIVWVVNSQTGQVQPKAVHTGMFHEKGVFILEGIQKGEIIVIAGIHTLTPGQIINPVPAQYFP